MKLVILGCGYSASRFVGLHGGGFERITATARVPESLAGLRGRDLRPVAFDGTAVQPALEEAVAQMTHLLVSVPPAETGDVALPLLDPISMPHVRWIGYLSTIGVYGDAEGGWVDEGSPLRATNPRNLRRVEAERGWMALAQARGALLQSFRIAGIYGPGRSTLSTLRDGTARRIVKPGQVFNRVHVDDIAGAIAAGIVRSHVTGPINVADDEPAPPQDVVEYAARLIGLPPPPAIAFETAEMTEMARSFYSSNKRVSNRRLRDELGYAFAYPTYREGLRAVLEDEP